MDIRDEYLAANHGDVAEAAAQLALHLTRDDPETLKAGYDRPSAILAAVGIFPEVDGPTIMALNHRSGWTVDDLPRGMRSIRSIMQGGDDPTETEATEAKTFALWVEIEAYDETGEPLPGERQHWKTALDGAAVFTGLDSEEWAIALGNWMQTFAYRAYRLLLSWEIDRTQYLTDDGSDVREDALAEYDQHRSDVAHDLLEMATLPGEALRPKVAGT